MTPPDEVMTRVRGEYREMPGLRLTLAQACRLWQVDALTCEAILRALVNEKFLHRTRDGAYVALPMPKGPLKVRAPLLDRCPRTG
jgi:hypothetical protein